MPIKYIGRTHDFKGKTLWEILGNLKNFGVGRVVVRSMFERYPEPSFFKIMKVETLPNEENRKVRVWVEKTFRGCKSSNLIQMCSTTYKTDFRLLPKDEVEMYCKCDMKISEEKIFPKNIDFPPLLKELIIRDKQMKGEQISEKLVLNLKLHKGRENHARIAKDGETPTVQVVSGLGTPISSDLYKGIDL